MNYKINLLVRALERTFNKPLGQTSRSAAGSVRLPRNPKGEFRRALCALQKYPISKLEKKSENLPGGTPKIF